MEDRYLKLTILVLAVCTLLLTVLLVAAGAALIQVATAQETERSIPGQSWTTERDEEIDLDVRRGLGGETGSAETDGSCPDRALLAQVIHAEARGEPYTGQVAVAAVVVNRVNDERWPSTVPEVVHQRVNGREQFVVSRGEPVDRHLEAALAALAGEDPTGGAFYFYSPELATCSWIRMRPVTVDIGNHRFAR